MLDRVLHRIAELACVYYRRIFVLALALLALSVGLSLRLRFESDVLALLPKDEPAIQTFRETLAEFGGVDLLLVVVGLPEGVPTDPYQDFAVDLGENLKALDEIEYVDYRIGELEELVASFLPNAFFLLDDEGRRLFERKLSDDGIRAQVAETRRLLSTPQSVAIKSLLKLDPLGLSEAFLDRLDVTRGAVKVDLSTGFFLSEDRRLMLLLAKPVRPAPEVDFTRRMIDRVNDVIADTEVAWREGFVSEAPPSPTVRLGGNYVTALDDERYIRRDVVVNAVTSMAGVLLLFLFAFRRLGLLLYAFLPLSLGLVMTFGLAGVSIGVLNPATAGFAALLIGLGIDFVIISYGRYVEERRSGQPMEKAMRVMSGASGRAVVVGGITSAATFYAFASTEFVGLRQMGFLTGSGILFCMVSVLFVLPAMLAWSDHRHSRRQSFPRLFLHGVGSARLIDFCLRRPALVLSLGAAATMVLGGLALRLEFEDSIREMRPKGSIGAAVEQEVAERFGSGFDFMMLVLEADSLEEVLELTDRSVQAVDAIAGGDEIVRYDSIASILPPRRRQQETLAWLERARSDVIDPVRIRATFLAAVEAEGMRAAPFLEGLDLFEQAASVSQAMSLQDLSVDDSTEHVLERYVRETESGWKSIVYLYPPPQVWKRDPPPSAQRLAADLGPQVVLSGVNVVSAFLRETVKSDAILASLVGFGVVTLLLWLDLRRPLDTILCLAPLVIGIVWMLGAMTLLGLQMNFFNIFVTTMIIGIGVDYGIHMMHRYREGRDGPIERLERGLQETGKAIALAALSTMVGFGSLSLSAYPGLRSMGIVAILGAFSTALVALTLLPAYLSLRLRRAPRDVAPAAAENE